MAELRRLATPEAAAEAAADLILEGLGAARESAGRATLAVSGGSTPKLLFRALKQRSFDWRAVHIFWADERMVPPTHADSNYRLALEELLGPAGVPEDQIHRIEGELQPAAAVERYSQEVRRVFGLQPSTLPRFDVVHLGMGADGHIASLFPGEPLTGDRAGIAAAVYATKQKSYRVTLLPGVLLGADLVVLLVAGADKAPALRAVRQEPFDPMARPAQLIDRQARRAVWVLDEAAADGVE